MDHQAELEQFGIGHKYRKRQERKSIELLALPKRVKYRCQSCGNKFLELELYFRSVEPHEQINDVAPWDPAFEINPMPIHNMTDKLRTI
jgi:hypothetical protein